MNVLQHYYVLTVHLYSYYRTYNTKVNSCLADMRWMITNNLRMNDSKTEFIVFRSPQLRCDLSGLSVNVGEFILCKGEILSVTFHQFLNFDDHNM